MSVVSEDNMATLAPDSPSTSPPFHRRRKSWARRVERICCQTLSYFPLVFVYGLTTWAVWVEVQVSFIDSGAWTAYARALLGVTLYLLANVSYTLAVFTPPGSPLHRNESTTRQRRGAQYEGLPTYENEEELAQPKDMSTVTAKSTGKQRYCKKCNTIKPDRTHHCSTCKECVLKMDHHCPWLATCVGLRNYKAFLLFLIYTSLFCWMCFAVSVSWVWNNLVERVVVEDGWRLVNTIMLSVLGGIIGFVLSGFTGWHVWLAVTGTTTIESLEKTRYLSPIRKTMQRQLERNYLGQPEDQSVGDNLREIHANMLPGVLRPEEGEVQHSITSPASARDSLQRSYASLEHQRENDRYEAYLDERDSEKLPNAFDLGWKRNLLHLFGEKPLFWALPVCNTTGDGWKWEVSDKWITAREEVTQERAQRARENARWQQHRPPTMPLEHERRSDLRWVPGQGFVPGPPRRTQEMQPLDRRKSDDADANSYATSSDEDQRIGSRVENWNDVPQDLLTAGGSRSQQRSRSSGRNKHD